MTVKIRETDHFIDGQKKKNDEEIAKRQLKEDAKAAFEGKVFGDLTGPEKDDLLKALAIQAGIIEE